MFSPSKGTMMDPQRQLRIYVGYDSPSIMKYLELPTTKLILQFKFSTVTLINKFFQY